MHKIVLIFILMVSSLWGGYQAPLNIQGATTVNSEKAYELYNKKVLFLDVRPSWMAKKQGKIKGAINYYVGDFSSNGLKKTLSTKNTPVVIYCNGVGCSLSEEAIVKMLLLEYKNIYFYRDGYPAWKHYRLPIQ